MTDPTHTTTDLDAIKARAERAYDLAKHDQAPPHGVREHIALSVREHFEHDIPALLDAIATVTTERDEARRQLDDLQEDADSFEAGNYQRDEEIEALRAQLATAHSDGYQQAITRLRAYETRWEDWRTSQWGEAHRKNAWATAPVLADYLEATKDQP